MSEEFYLFIGSEELFIFIFSCLILFIFLMRWYKPLLKAWPKERNHNEKLILGSLPVIFAVSIFIVLTLFSSFDVVDSILYKTFYTVLGFSWIFLGLILMSMCFDFMWIEDVIQLGNRAALAAIIGSFFALGVIYAGSNIGDGPGWWCVFFAGAFGLAAWVLLGLIYNLFTGIFERITVDRDMGCGLRFCFYQIVSGGILAYACSGDWTSFSATVEEFIAGGWPVLPLTAIMILIEFYYNLIAKRKGLV